MKYLTTIISHNFKLYSNGKEIKTEILIIATPEKVWSILTNFEANANKSLAKMEVL